MEELVKQVASKTGISEDQARTAVATVIGFLKDKLPQPIGAHLDSFAGGGSTGESSGGLGDLASKVGGMLNQ